MKQLIKQVADENGNISVDEQASTHPEIQFDISIRDSGFELYESENSRLFIKTEDMEQDVFVEIVPTSEGPITEINTQVEQSTLTLCEPADRAKSPDVEESTTEIIMD